MKKLSMTLAFVMIAGSFAVNAQEKSHFKAIQLLHERHTQSIAEAAEKEKQLQLKLNETADISRVELLNLKSTSFYSFSRSILF